MACCFLQCKELGLPAESFSLRAGLEQCRFEPNCVTELCVCLGEVSQPWQLVVLGCQETRNIVTL